MTRRIREILSLLLVVAMGLWSRTHPAGFQLFDKSLGDALYATASYLALRIVFPRPEPTRIAAVAMVFCTSVELSQLTGIPARYRHHLLVRWLIGTTFSFHDLGCYAVGIAVAFLADRWSRRA